MGFVLVVSISLSRDLFWLIGVRKFEILFLPTAWLLEGLAGFLCDQFVKRFMGNNEARYRRFKVVYFTNFMEKQLLQTEDSLHICDTLKMQFRSVLGHCYYISLQQMFAKACFDDIWILVMANSNSFPEHMEMLRFHLAGQWSRMYGWCGGSPCSKQSFYGWYWFVWNWVTWSFGSNSYLESCK